MLRRSFLALAAAAPAWEKIKTRGARVEKVFDSPGPKPNGLQATNESLWILDQGNNHAYLVSFEDGRVLRDLHTDSDRGSGITYLRWRSDLDRLDLQPQDYSLRCQDRRNAGRLLHSRCGRDLPDAERRSGTP